MTLNESHQLPLQNKASPYRSDLLPSIRVTEVIQELFEEKEE